MSQALPQANNVPSAGTGSHHYPLQSAQKQASMPGVSHFIDGSGPIFSMYLERAEEEDKKMAESWKADADGILFFTGLFSAAVASLISVSIQDIQQNPQDTSNFYLANIYQTMANPNPLNISSPSSPPPFTPPTFAVWVNSLWFLSLAISITCALLATLLQQWARRYLKVTQPRYSLHKRARMRSFFAEGVEKSFLPLAVEALPTLLHLSLFLFFSGLVVFLWNVNLTIFQLILSWVGVCTALYGCITLIPIFRRDSPYYTPLTPLARPIAVTTLKVSRYLRYWLYWLVRLCAFCCHSCCYSYCYSYCRSCFNAWDSIRALGLGIFWHDRLEEILETTLMSPEEAALQVSSLIDTRAFMWTLDGLDEDHELERFFSSLPDFRSSKVVDDPLPHLTEDEKEKVSKTLLRFLDFTLSSDLLPEAVKHQRAIMCAKALDLAQFSAKSGDCLCDTIFDHRTQQTTNIGSITENSPTEQTVFVQVIATGTAARPQQRDDSWFRRVAPNALGIPETVLRDYAANGASLSLAILIYVIRQQFTYLQYSPWPASKIRYVLGRGSHFNARDTSLELQHKFCTLWNQIVLKAQKDNNQRIAALILQPIRNIYVMLHHDTDSAPTQFSDSTRFRDPILRHPSSYPVCKVAGHVHDDSAPTSNSFTAQHDNTAISPSLASPDSPSSSILASLHVVESPTDLPSPDNFRPAQTTIEGLHSPLTSADPANASVIQDIDISGTTMPLPTPETSTSAPLSSHPRPPGSLQHNTDQLTPSDPPNLPYLASVNPILDRMLPTGSHHSIIVSTPPSASPGMTIAADLDAPANPAPSSREKDPSDRPYANRTYTTVARDLSLPFPLPPSTTDSHAAIAGSSSSEPTVECIGDHPPGPSDLHYDIV